MSLQKQYREINGKYKAKRFKKTKRVATITVIAVAAAFVILGIFNGSSAGSFQAEQTVIEKAKDMTRERVEILIREKTDGVLDIIWEGESNKRELEEGEVFYTNDPSAGSKSACARVGGKRGINCDSWGAYQWKIGTVQMRFAELHGEQLTEKEALLLALNNEQARQLAEECIIGIEGCVWQWSAARKHETFLSQEIPLIRELTELL